MIRRGLTWAGQALTLALVAVLAVSSGSATAVPTASADPKISGLIVHYSSGVSAAGAHGSFLGQEKLAAAGFKSSNAEALGAGWHSIRFEVPQVQSQALAAATLLSKQQGVVAAYLDSNLAPTGLAPVQNKSPNLEAFVSGVAGWFGGIPSAKSLKTATAVRSLKIIDAWSAEQPSTAALKLTWQKPLSTFGAKVAGYRVQVSMDGGKKIAYSSTLQSVATALTLTREIAAGHQVWARVAAVTKLSGAQRVGKYSAWRSGTATTIPAVPKFITEPKATTGSSPRWLLLSGADTGGLPVTYQAVATKDNVEVDTCTTQGDTCGFSSLQAGQTYSVSLRASNSRGVSKSFDAAAITDPLFQYQWGLSKEHGINAESAWTRTTGQGVVVAVIDSGVTNHPDLSSQVLRRSDGSVYGYDFISNVNNAQDGDSRDENPADPNAGSDWHGTHVSGIIAAAANDQGVVGVAPGAKLLELRALGANGGVESDLIAALHWAIGVAVPGTPANEHPARVVNLSLGYVNACDQATTSVLQSVYNAGVTVVTAAGNDNSFASISYPGNCVPTINVGATGFTRDRAEYSNFGLSVDISAPGGDQLPNSGAPMLPGSSFSETGLILSSLNDGQDAPGNPNYGYEQGTSMAAPFVAGVVALMYSARPDFTPALVWQAIKATATGWDTTSVCFAQAAIKSCGAGIINAGEAVTWVLSHTDPIVAP